MESAGDLAAATVKSLKDLCTALVHSGESILEISNDQNAVQRSAEALLKDANRGVKHARQFLSIATKAERTPELLNINKILANNDTLLHSLIGEDIDLQISLAPQVGLVSADRNELVQMISSLLASSRETLPLGGAVSIETSNVEIDNEVSGSSAGLQSGIYVSITVSADGCGLLPERRTAPIRTIVERIGGHLETTNDTRNGNIHRVYLPRVESFAAQTNTLPDVAQA
jgi:hypothetical protein